MRYRGKGRREQKIDILLPYRELLKATGGNFRSDNARSAA